MSLFDGITIQCPVCDTLADFDAAGSVNADRRPDLREDILQDRFQVLACPRCGEPMRLEPLFNYLDMEHGLWLAAYPPGRIGDHLALEDEVQDLFDRSYGAQATPAAQEVGEGLRPRLTFGWPATREKLFLRQHDLNDISVEMMKLDLLRRLPEAPLRPGVELRLVDVLDNTFAMIWIETAAEEVVQEFEVSRALLAEIEGDPEPWEPVRRSLTSGIFVDMQKLYLGEGRDAA